MQIRYVTICLKAKSLGKEEAKRIMTENNNLVTSTQGIIKEALHKLGFDEGMYDLIKEPFKECYKCVSLYEWMMALLKHSQVTVRNIMMLLDQQKGRGFPPRC